jgi:UDP-N-acetylmuramoyl-tripeptide--D-alanyl-D-alanine ligase
MASLLDLPITAAARSLENAVIEPGRLQRRRVAGALVLDDTYNSNPASARAALEVLAACPPPRTAILGDMLELGERGPALHEELGRLTRDLDLVIAVGPLGCYLKRGNPKARHLPDTEAARSLIHDLPLEGSMLFKASRGMRFERLIEDISHGVLP